MRLGPGFWKWSGFSAAWAFILGAIARGHWQWLCIVAAMLLGFLTDCALDIFAARLHQRKLREEDMRNHPRARRFESSETITEVGDQRSEVGGQRKVRRKIMYGVLAALFFVLWVYSMGKIFDSLGPRRVAEPWSIVCGTNGVFSFTDENGYVVTDSFFSRADAERARDAQRLWSDRYDAKKRTRDATKWEACPP